MSTMVRCLGTCSAVFDERMLPHSDASSPLTASPPEVSTWWPVWLRSHADNEGSDPLLWLAAEGCSEGG
eukprot:4466688-Prymnesium_polylepis.2